MHPKVNTPFNSEWGVLLPKMQRLHNWYINDFELLNATLFLFRLTLNPVFQKVIIL